ncbi:MULTISPECIES: lysozyme inhibitor LprI family protein [unclassified Bradyrhizobium]|uniref:lysozyme inhibitor LprI family protein n=1 Tax=unclassified Bradyrhizobium TaxID=2631580 RepID=UPI0028EC2759|nr:MULTISPECIES: lysozyme inhibitor LprI family protein [unclassified Bradyrhizobium]
MRPQNTFHGGCIATIAFFALAWTASAQDAGRVARCVAIQDLDERIECLEGRSSAPEVSTPGRSRAPQIGPSFDCRMATASIERAICGDAVLSEWDLRMGQQYQQALRLRKSADRQSLIDSQRSWIQQRNTGCGAVAGNAVWSCVLEATKERIAALSEVPPISLDPTPTASPSQLPQSQARAQNAPPVASPTVAPKSSDASSAPKPNPPESTSGTNPLLVLIFIVGAIAGAIAVYKNIRRREEEQRRTAERQRLVAKYGAEIADRILARVVWQGMTEEQLLESRGFPADKDYEVRKSVSKQTWKYGQTGKNRFSNRIFLENGIVTGWKE